ncbi:MAG: EamA family transporter RarD [Verrucomicrobiota bacterium]
MLDSMNPQKKGIAAALAAFSMWGILPVFWKALSFLEPASIVAHRTFWSFVCLLLITLAAKNATPPKELFRSRATIAWSAVSSTLLASNWLLYVWAVLNDRILEGALGYYLNPFFNMLFGTLWFAEKHSPRQLFAIALAFAGVLIQIPAGGHFPWLPIALALTFSLYGAARKKSSLDARDGLTLEASLLAPLGLAWIATHPSDAGIVPPSAWPQAILIISTGIATTLPLLCFTYAARKIRLTTLGMLQFLGPTLQWIIGWRFYGESMDSHRVLSFGMIWVAVALYLMSGRGKKSCDA